MITAPIKTPFPWYDDINKQNRYKDSCAAVGKFKLLTPLNSILPFEIRTGEVSVSVVSWKVYCAEDGTEMDDITSQIGLINITLADNQDYISYDGTTITGLALDCGTYYSVLVTNTGTYYSELFNVEDIDDIAFVQSLFPLFTPWRWYDDQAKQNRFLGACQAYCGFYLLTGNDALLPFMFRKPSMSNVINSWVLRDLSGTCEHNLDTALLNLAVFGAYDYVYYNGEEIENLPCGVFESIITINEIPYYSEIIKITNQIASNGDNFYILQESGDLLLQENSSGLLQE